MVIIPQEIEVGTDFYLPILYTFELCGQKYPLDISGYVVEMQVGIGVFLAGNTPIIDVSTVNGDIQIDGPGGKINIWIPNAEIVTSLIGDYEYAVKVTTNLGLVEKLFGGPFKIKGWGKT